jgi:hypothetical protein
MIAHYDMYHDKTTRTTSSLLILWDGNQLIDAAAGYSDNDALVTELLGLRATPHAPPARTPSSIPLRPSPTRTPTTRRRCSRCDEPATEWVYTYRGGDPTAV